MEMQNLLLKACEEFQDGGSRASNQTSPHVSVRLSSPLSSTPAATTTHCPYLTGLLTIPSVFFWVPLSKWKPSQWRRQTQTSWFHRPHALLSASFFATWTRGCQKSPEPVLWWISSKSSTNCIGFFFFSRNLLPPQPSIHVAQAHCGAHITYRMFSYNFNNICDFS